MKVGDVVIPANLGYDSFQLASGGSRYTFAICISVDPFVLVSSGSDMRWETTIAGKEHMFASLCKADDKIIENCMRRIDS